MVPDFARTTRALAADRGPGRAVLALALALLALWTGWMALGDVALYESSELARLQATGTATLRAPVAATVTGVDVALGDRVEEGTRLVALDSEEVALQLAAARARLAQVRGQRTDHARAGEADAQGRRADASAQAAALAQARAELAEVTVRLEEAEGTLRRLEGLEAAGAVSHGEVARAEAEAGALRARRRAALGEVQRRASERARAEATGEATGQRGEATLRGLQAEIAAAEAEVARLEEALARRSVRAPTAGRVGELAPLVAGQRVDAGGLLAVVVPDAPLQVWARFAPERAVGRVRPGQDARVRIVGANGGLLGARKATVARVGSEPGRDGLVPVVLTLDHPSPDLRHGLVAEVEVQVERLAPWALALRAAGSGS